MSELLNAHPFALGAAGFFISVFLLREVIWRTVKPVKACETCAHTGTVKRVVRGKYWIEIPLLGLGLTVGLVVHLVLVFSMLVFIWRTFGSYLACAKCGSERLLTAKP